jgi:hypothetical protein
MADVTLSRETLFFNPRKKEYRYLFTEQRRYSFDTTKGNVTARTAFEIMPLKIVWLSLH